MRAITSYDYADRPSTLDVEGLGGTLMQPIVTSAGYLPSGPLDSLSLGNGLTELRPYDQRYYPDRIAIAGGSTLLDWDYATDDLGNVLTITDIFDAVNNRTYGYQEYQYFLTQGDGPWGDLAWTYDTIGNRLTEVRDGQPADVYDYLPNGAGGNLPQLDTILLGDGGTRAYLYDEVGNQTQVANGANVVEFSYDDASRLARIDRASASASASLLYDGRSFLRNSAGSRPDTTGDGVFCDGFESGDTSAWPSDPSACAEVGVTRPVYSSEGMLHSLDHTINVGSPLADRYLFYFGSRPVASMELVGGSATFQYLSVDHLGTPILAMDDQGSSAWEGGFEPFGRDWLEGMPDGAQENGVFLRFPGQWLDETWADASLGEAIAYNVQRWYEPGTGRYPRPDPAWRPTRIQELNHYLYVAANPLLYIDPLGLERLRVCCNEWDKQNLEAIQKRASDLQSAAINQTPVRPQPGPSPFGETNCAGQDFGKPGEPDTQNWNIGKGACADACIRAHEQYHRDLCRSRQGFAQLMAWKQGTDEAFALLQELECLKHALLRGRVEVDVDPLGPDNRMSRGHP